MNHSRTLPRRSLLVAVWTLPLTLLALPTLHAADAPVDFTRDVKPILSNHCFACHGPDENLRKADLRLDVRDAAIAGGAIVPGKSAESELIARIVTDDPETFMPPPRSKKPAIPKEQVAILKRWIDQGAKYDAHWAYVPPQRPTPPALPEAIRGWVRNPVDAWVAEKQLANGLKPAPEADRRTLIRRLSFDLRGLPPTPEEVEQFVADQSADAYAKLLDRMFASPHYGERMALYWLDLVRYADTGGYHSDNHRDIALFRDYVIEAFQRNKPFHQFTFEQIAGDLMPNASTEQKIASGYNRLLMTTEEGGSQAKEYQAKYVADRVRNSTAVWLAQTVGCAECHNHKYDPISQKDFYRWGSFFTDIQELAVGRQPQTPIPTPEQEKQFAALTAKWEAAKQSLQAVNPQWDAAQAKWEATLQQAIATGANPWVTITPTDAKSTGKQILKPLDDQSLLATGANPDRATYTLTIPVDRENLTGLRLEVLKHASLTDGALSRANGNFVVTKIRLDVKAKDAAKAVPVELAKVVADYEQPGFPIASTISPNGGPGWAINGHISPADHQALFVFAKPLAVPVGSSLVLTLVHESPFAKHNIGRLRVATTTAKQPELSAGGVPATVQAALKTAADKRTPTERTLLMSEFRKSAPETESVRKSIADLEAARKALEASYPKTLVTVATNRRMLRVLPRGNWLDDSGPIVEPGVPEFLPQIPKGEKADRLALAKWLTSRDNPLVARVFVNRMWKLMFGQGLVRSVEDFGTQGTPPTHPQLLDWLALEFIDSGWDVQRLLRLMLESATYRQSSVATDDLRNRDPQNLWLARQNRFRIDAEMVRDNALAISGLLNPQVGGASVKPYQPEGYWSYLNFPKRDWQADLDANQYRRGIYTYWCRSFLHPSLAAFDAPTREECTADRPRSSTPLQALVLLNDPSYVEAARAFASKAMTDAPPSIDARIAWMFRRAVGRSPSANESAVLAGVYAKHLAQYRSDQPAVDALLAIGLAKIPEKLDRAELAAWTGVARVLLNLHETITRN
ncbi:PSD1 and planctomycete cytochrome C domain-containing protein [Tuwongella immobilis]|uniref:Cytochrome c domain-containing protein n=1 Tax=Tuwongella immobilis TaxID=692036 RepID=A0A6C2YS54_9BACT|nr:PSD1 and planctomycete cytochrome C domain-containing protein [Tuwongella immobilis]VIP04498.1 Uncharacterized protein OS=Pirellula staleyi (strain ATCC 27377 / DSM 6068 / ICPB 4128) GN=Psta_3360 PE=4 SV=1: PSCyt1: PSCyt2: PSD1 [Tuwongella immobilis]VTS06358.1 Uncharacterized protein OS=Pirellula staleyi (strain ATCC 27377 / DSM 6068 / ICPB 4128) GN=Psta_3360 PE=4 SV=1: PSCyt1: PSCyt2: PSD1 [Tuwongella immobilis]